jgi:hypothetical protein
MLAVFLNFYKKISLNLPYCRIKKTPDTHASITLKARQEADPVSAPSTIDSTRSRRLGFMEAEGRVPDDFNTIGSSEIESIFYDNK